MKILEAKNIILRKLEIEDAEKAFENWAGVEEIANLSDFRVNTGIEETRTIIEKGLGDEDEEECTWGIALKDTNEPIGFVKLYQMSIENKKCKVTWALGKKWWGKGLAAEALKKVIEYLFKEKGYRIVICEYYSYMEKMQNIVLNEIGMKKEAELRARKIDLKTGEVYSKIICSITKEEFLK